MTAATEPMVAVIWGIASDELESIDPERGAMAPPELPVGPESDSVPELLCAVASSSDELESVAELESPAESDVADSEADVVEFEDSEVESATVALVLADEAVDDSVDVAALALEDATAEDVVEAEDAVVVVVVAPETQEMANAARTRTWITFMLATDLVSLFETDKWCSECRRRVHSVADDHMMEGESDRAET
ncbi:Hypothetical protein PHPALM_11819 [Phytophthora palmivora]|uniref:Uncharacterized protein n=1 Tax=Phytophthora palmivora TaxID=4796 RepID=A0A2P4Y1B5_9STRA|nr:Hypothetical protein PHPALM_11819 [Phytophthora palmivora]